MIPAYPRYVVTASLTSPSRLPRSSDLAIKHPERLRVAAVTRHDQQCQHRQDTLMSDCLLIVRHDSWMQPAKAK